MPRSYALPLPNEAKLGLLVPTLCTCTHLARIRRHVHNLRVDTNRVLPDLLSLHINVTPPTVTIP